MTKKTEMQWMEEATLVLTEIHTKFPELAKYIEEMPTKFGKENSKDNKASNMKAYVESLKVLLKNYELSHHQNKTL